MIKTNQLLNTPYPKPNLLFYVKIALGIAFGVAFILIVFQPFGTASFQHPYKTWILLGYGVVISISLAIFYALVHLILGKKGADHWTIFQEVILFFIAIVLSISSCFVYASLVFSWSFEWRTFAYFMLNAGSVAFLPCLAVFFYLYSKWKDVVRSAIRFDEDKSTHITLLGQNKGEQIETSPEQILFLKAHDNYVVLHLERDGNTQRHIIRATLEQMLQQLGEQQFKRIHRSYVVNLEKVENLLGNKSKAQLALQASGQQVPISRKYYEEMKALYP